MSEASATGAAHDATVVAEDGNGRHEALRRMEQALDEARATRGAAARKVEKCEAHRAGARGALAAAEDEVHEAEEALVAYTGEG